MKKVFAFLPALGINIMERLSARTGIAPGILHGVVCPGYRCHPKYSPKLHVLREYRSGRRGRNPFKYLPLACLDLPYISPASLGEATPEEAEAKRVELFVSRAETYRIIPVTDAAGAEAALPLVLTDDVVNWVADRVALHTEAEAARRREDEARLKDEAQLAEVFTALAGKPDLAGLLWTGDSRYNAPAGTKPYVLTYQSSDQPNVFAINLVKANPGGPASPGLGIFSGERGKSSVWTIGWAGGGIFLTKDNLLTVARMFRALDSLSTL